MNMQFQTLCLVIKGHFVQCILKRPYTGWSPHSLFISGNRGIGTKLFFLKVYLSLSATTVNYESRLIN